MQLNIIDLWWRLSLFSQKTTSDSFLLTDLQVSEYLLLFLYFLSMSLFPPPLSLSVFYHIWVNYCYDQCPFIIHSVVLYFTLRDRGRARGEAAPKASVLYSDMTSTHTHTRLHLLHKLFCFCSSSLLHRETSSQ